MKLKLTASGPPPPHTSDGRTKSTFDLPIPSEKLYGTVGFGVQPRFFGQESHPHLHRGCGAKKFMHYRGPGLDEKDAYARAPIHIAGFFNAMACCFVSKGVWR